MKNIIKMNRLFNSFKYAWQGIREVITKEKNMKIHIFILVSVVFTGIVFKVSAIEWITIAICAGLVLSAEMFNTAIELLVDKVSPEKNSIAGRIKDIAAGAVLITAIASIFVGMIIFIPKIINCLFQ